MQYVGGKHRIRKELAVYLESVREGRTFVEPFCGGCNITAEMSGYRIASDLCEDVILLWKAASDGWEPPTKVLEDEYKAARSAPSSAYRGFVGFGCSFGGKFFGGYARTSAGRKEDFAMAAHNSIIRKAKTLRGVLFSCGPYNSLSPLNSLVYCDPPYANTTQGYSSTSFDSARFWNTMLEWSKQGNTVLVSEYFAPDFCREVWRKETNVEMRSTIGREVRIEKLFQVG
jgi:DNA adenine methylase